MLDRQIYLNGMPGSGKSSLGRRAAQDLGLPFTELDGWISERTGMTIRELLEQRGEETLRRIETGALVLLTRSRPGIILLGGGTAMKAENRRIMRAWGSIILLDRQPEAAAADLTEEERTLMGENPEERLREMYELRMPVYRALADVTIRNDGSYDRTLMILERVLKERYHV